MDWGQAFSVANTTLLVCWLMLILLPRFDWLKLGLKRIVIGSLCLVYAIVIALSLSGVEGGGFGSLEQVKALFRSDAVVFAGWLHYLAFDLFVGLWIAEQADAKKLHRLWQVPILIATFMLGPIGLLLFYGVEGGIALAGKSAKASASGSSFNA